MTKSETENSPQNQPPMFLHSPLSNKYEMILDFKSGNYEKQVKVSRETHTFEEDLIRELNKTLLEASETL